MQASYTYCAHAARTMSLDVGLILIYSLHCETGTRDTFRWLTLPTASPTKSFTLISQLERRLLPSCGDPTTAELTTTSGFSEDSMRGFLARWYGSGIDRGNEGLLRFNGLGAVSECSSACFERCLDGKRTSSCSGMDDVHDGLRTANELSAGGRKGDVERNLDMADNSNCDPHV